MRIFALAVLIVLMIATFADAECAWVLWEWNEPDPVSAKLDGWKPKTALATEEACNMILKLEMKDTHKSTDRIMAQIPPEKKDRPLGEILDPQTMKLFSWLMQRDWRCLPDTVKMP